MTPLDPDAFTVRRAAVRDGLEIAFVHEGVGGFPLLLVHGYPEIQADLVAQHRAAREPRDSR